ncbi:MAG: class I SAM-dependent methyltransferase [Bacteroidales bacterium]|nr:class I SAM-dependent methyltransferase [Bacteroidales bacterium]
MGPQNYHTKCPICDSSELRPLKKYQNHHLTRCKKCRFVFSQQIPSFDELKIFYEQYSYTENYYISPITLKRYQEWLKKLEKFRLYNRILDVGCGNGIFLLVAKNLGWETYGIELSKVAVDITRSKGITVFEGTLNDHLSFLPQMDIIVSIETIEHTSFPATEIADMYKILRKGGALIITTPNFNSITRRILQNKHPDILFPEHLSYFTPNTLKKLLKANSFSIQRLTTTGISITRIKNILGKENENPFTEQSQDEKVRRFFEKTFILQYFKKIINSLLTLLRLGDSVFVLAIKK